MNQPELGFKIAELRKSKGFTQQQLAEACNVNIRTIQRIELGKVEPRSFTVKQIVETLGFSYVEVIGHQEGSGLTFLDRLKTFFFVDKQAPESAVKTGLMWAWIMGIVYFAIGFPETILTTKSIESFLTSGEVFWYVVSKLIGIVSYLFFMRGFVILGKEKSMPLLSTVAYMLIAGVTVFYIVEIMAVLFDFSLLTATIGESVVVGALVILFGYCLFRSERELGRVGVIAGALEMVAGFTFVTVVLGFIGLFLLIPIEILEIFILLKFYVKQADLGFKGSVKEVLK